MSLSRLSALTLALLLASGPLAAKNRVDLDYLVRFQPETDQALVSITLEEGQAVRSLAFDLGKKGYFSDFQGEGEWLQESPSRGVWKPKSGRASLSYKVRVSHEREDGRFDARMTPDWALLRGDDLVPSAHLDQVDGTELVSRLQFELPRGWPSVETGWPRVGKNRFRIDNPERLFDRPTGWMLAGKIGSRRAKLGNTDVTVAAPKGEGMRRMDTLTLLSFVWPHAQYVFPRDPDKLLVVGAGEPMWRGGLSAGNSLFLHADRPLVSENGTSSLVHELTHVFSRIRDTDRSDWITEGLAEYYAIELVRRGGGMSQDRYTKVLGQLRKWSKPVTSLRTEHSTGEITARSVLLLVELDKEIRETTKGELSLDNVTRGLMRMDRVSTQDFIEVTESVLRGPSKVLDTKLLR